MKTIILIALTGVLFSCVKDYTCTCKSVSLHPVVESVTIIHNKTRHEAKKECQNSHMMCSSCDIK